MTYIESHGAITHFASTAIVMVSHTLGSHKSRFRYSVWRLDPALPHERVQLSESILVVLVVLNADPHEQVLPI